MKIAFIVNPTANGGRCAALAEQIRQWSFPEGVEWSIHMTQAPGDGARIAGELASQTDCCCAVGGDGTVHEVAQVLFQEKNARLGIIPAGTGNDIVKTLGWARDFAVSMQRSLGDAERIIDAGLADGHFFLNIASIGFDAQVLIEMEAMHRKNLSKFSYLYGLLVSLKRYRDISVHWASEETCAETPHQLFLLAAGNGRYYGGGFQILPQAELDDGLLDFCAVYDVPRRTVLRLLPSIFRATHGAHTDYVHMSRSRKKEIEVREPFYLNLDGELIRYREGARIGFEVCPRAIRLAGGQDVLHS